MKKQEEDSQPELSQSMFHLKAEPEEHTLSKQSKRQSLGIHVLEKKRKNFIHNMTKYMLLISSK